MTSPTGRYRDVCGLPRFTRRWRPMWLLTSGVCRTALGLLSAVGPISTTVHAEATTDRQAGLRPMASTAPIAGRRVPTPVTRDLLRLDLARVGDALPPGWRLEPVRGQRPPNTIVVDSGSMRYLRIAGQARAAFLGYALTPPISETSGALHWRWRVVRSPDGTDLRTRSGDDAAIRVFVVFRRTGWLNRTPRALFYTIGGAEPSSYQGRRSFTSPDLYVVRAGAAQDAREWVDVVVDPAADYRRSWGAEPPPIEGVGLMQDTDQTHLAAVADVQSLTWKPRP
ncbi:DUF3047 domain-containing protein [Gemmatimonas groenlandica]|uniref:DUF3047 domain-containing protein n=1 Tax=Gemmatimonas groenlandica TaxID=2732249 RepID=A0A6M4ITB4_9BACT|nr:DUF3047 domain-containing protein [Gemmatimonas groenlandica]QJR37900.1 DUF3047 domain-containing protein [Gemmatimonas groenlandica]